ncbi:serine O-acetyltransferase [Desulfosediminicola flagellatus]|uniref:serine O-acetyltransferase n=1 Tax=Desulfosediminicola flagellatus TaxID=2569541 RepID=UPI0010ABC7C8|nr:serine acetyltransferase [Desulfosediminicola flagellatus]
MKIVDDFRVKGKWLYGEESQKSFFRSLCSDASLSMVLFRSMDFFNTHLVTKPLAAVICKLNAILCGAVIGCGASFGRGFVILHSVGVVINKKTCAGCNVVIESGVVIGEEKQGCPVLGNDIFIGSGAKVFGGITIGDNVTIGANAVVNKSFPSDVVIGGVPARILLHKKSNQATAKL